MNTDERRMALLKELFDKGTGESLDAEIDLNVEGPTEEILKNKAEGILATLGGDMPLPEIYLQEKKRIEDFSQFPEGTLLPQEFRIFYQDWNQSHFKRLLEILEEREPEFQKIIDAYHRGDFSEDSMLAAENM